ncbi:hypothetical protein PR048_020587 [Dryococelus australis]|uniref:Uncharacterized protein n=1 Tax=Dryococelus australis TaxID=614101 RepID=A0ABQ9H6W3_9NEOP|nr:hypothetical protein PR048_020587 [Dryococelus australis]
MLSVNPTAASTSTSATTVSSCATAVSTSAAALSVSVAAASTSKLGFVPYSDVGAAEFTWVIHVISTKASFRAQEVVSKILKKMFTNNRVASEMQLIMCIDESLNRILKLLRMDLAIRYWDENKNEVSSRFWNSSFMGHSSASDLLRGCKEGLEEEVEQGKAVQVSMDWPNVNCFFLELLNKDMKTCEEDSTQNCAALHVVHGAFQGAFRNTGWEIDKFLKSFYNVFKDSPAWRTDFVTVTKCNNFPLKFCNCLWLESVVTCERAIKILPRLKTYFKSKSAQLPDTYSVKKSAEILEDHLLLPKLHFLTIASSFEPFLREFQTPKPMFPSLHSAVENLTRELMERFIKPTILESAHTIYKLINIDVESVDNCVKLRQVKIGLAARQSLDEARGKEYKFVQASICLDPKKILTKPEQCKTGFKTRWNAFGEPSCDCYFGCHPSVWSLALHFTLTRLSFQNLSRANLDSTVFILEEYKDVWQVVKIFFMSSRGNAFVEGGFSINKEMLVENLHEESLVALRRVWDGIQDAGGEDAVVMD